jgi:hypothetical protein
MLGAKHVHDAVLLWQFECVGFNSADPAAASDPHRACPLCVRMFWWACSPQVHPLGVVGEDMLGVVLWEWYAGS